MHAVLNPGLCGVLLPELGERLPGSGEHDGDELAQVQHVVPVRVPQLVDRLHLLHVKLVSFTVMPATSLSTFRPGKGNFINSNYGSKFCKEKKKMRYMYIVLYTDEHVCTSHTDKKTTKFSSYIRKFNGIGCKGNI